MICTLPAWPRLSFALNVLCPACRGSDLEQPFRCPLDYLLPLKELDASGVDYRPPGFLALPQVRQHMPRCRGAVC